MLEVSATKQKERGLVYSLFFSSSSLCVSQPPTVGPVPDDGTGGHWAQSEEWGWGWWWSNEVEIVKRGGAHGCLKDAHRSGGVGGRVMFVYSWEI